MVDYETAKGRRALRRGGQCATLYDGNDSWQEQTVDCCPRDALL